MGATVIYFLIFFLLDVLVTGEQLSADTANTILFYANFSTQPVLAVCVVIFLAKFRVTPAEAGLRKAKPLPFLIGVLFAAGTVFVATIPESIFSTLLSFIGYETSSVIEDMPIDGGPVFPALFLIALMPAIFEEFIFRGIILESTKKLGTAQACLLNGLLFSLFHCNPSQTCYTFLMGAAWALVAIRTNSILPTIIVHFLNNGYSVLMMYFNVTVIPDIVAYGIFIAAFAFTGLGLFYFLKANKTGNQRPSLHAAPFWKGAMGGLIFNGVLWLFVLISGIAANLVNI